MMTDLLPRTIRDMIAVIGWQPTIAFVRAFGGKRVHIPKRITSSWAAVLAEEIGEEATEKLVKHAGDTSMNVPFCRDAMIAMRNIEIVRTYNDGVSVNELVDRYNISHRQLQNILKTTDMSAAPAVEQRAWQF